MLITRIKRFLVGEPLSNHMASNERIPKWKALAVLSSDALSSVAYATEEILIPLTLAVVAGAVVWSVPIALAIALLLIIVTLSYRQTIEAYPNGGGAYTVAKENLGTYPGLVAGAALLIDYTLTVSVSVAAGVANIDSAFPFLREHRVLVCAAIILIIMVLNLRGLRESATIFAFPTYIFIFAFLAMLGVGTFKVMTGMVPATAPLVQDVYPSVTIFLILRAFSSGCAALSGIEAISNGVQNFRTPAPKNAKITLAWMAAILTTLFLGMTLLVHMFGIAPHDGETVVSSLASRVFGRTFFYFLVQVSTALILFLAANTSFSGFPNLSSLLAQDRFLPRQLASRGDRLVFSNGIIGLSVAAILLVFLFNADVHHLIPLYAIGVFLSFTLSQAGMVSHHWKEREEGWFQALLINAAGALTTFVVLLVVASTKFKGGAWMVLVFIPIVVFFFTRIHRHYVAVGKELSMVGVTVKPITKLKHTVIVPISGVHRGVVDAIRYAISISDDVRACYVEIDPDMTARVRQEWSRWAPGVAFVVLQSPFRSVIRPLLDYIDDVERTTGDEMITVIVPEFVTSKWRYGILHNQTAFLIRAALMFKPGKVVTSIRYHLRGC